MKTADFTYELPNELIAQTPREPRDHSRLLVVDRTQGTMERCYFYQIGDYLSPGDVLVLNNSRVIPARLLGQREGGGRAELLLLHRRQDGLWTCLARPGHKLGPGAWLGFNLHGNGLALEAEIVDRGTGGTRLVRFSDESLLEKMGQVPLPPYIRTLLADPERYQTVYACSPGSAASPTAGLHFTPQLLEGLQEKGIELVFVTLHIGLDTFQPVREEDPRQHSVHKEYGEVSTQAAAALNRARAEGRRIIAVGTTSVRLLEQAAQGGQADVSAFQGWASLFILPGYAFRAVDCLVTNFHLPRSSNLMLVAALAGWDRVLRAYQEAIRERYRFYSFGDAMLVL